MVPRAAREQPEELRGIGARRRDKRLEIHRLRLTPCVKNNSTIFQRGMPFGIFVKSSRPIGFCV
jgi:hypothetical protein